MKGTRSHKGERNIWISYSAAYAETSILRMKERKLNIALSARTKPKDSVSFWTTEPEKRGEGDLTWTSSSKCHKADTGQNKVLVNRTLIRGLVNGMIW